MDLMDRIESEDLRKLVMPMEEAVRLVPDKCTLAVSGFTKSGDPKTFLPALGRYFSENLPQAQVTLYSGASLSEQTESPLSPFIQKRAPYMSSDASRKLILSGRMDFSDVHLSGFARNLMYGFYGDIDLAVVEVSRLRADGTAVLTTSVGVSTEALAKAKRIIFEVNTSVPDMTGFHDLILPTVYPEINWPLPLLNVSDRVGGFYARFDPRKVVAIVESKTPDHPVAFKPTTDVERKIAENVVDFLAYCQKQLGWEDRLPPIQSGVGNIANAVVSELCHSPFRKLRFWTEVFQDGMLRALENPEKFEAASATAVSLSATGQEFFHRNLEHYREKLVLRPMWVSNSPELITRLFVIALNTPIEVDIYGHVNSTHVDGSRIVNGLGGSGDFLRNAYVSAVHTPSIRRLKDGRTVSCVMPYVRHIDHTEHDIKCVITEQGFALNTEILSPRKRAERIIETCAHPYFRPLLHEYIKLGGTGDEPRPTDMDALQGWWREYERACLAFPGPQAAELESAEPRA